MGSYIDICAKLTLGILCLILQINLMGKSNLAPTSPMDQIQNYVLGGIIGGVIYNGDITILQFFLVLVIWTLLVLIVKYLKEHTQLVKTIVDGNPVTLIQDGKVLVNQCSRVGISGGDLMFKLRSAGVSETNKIKKAIYEQNGQLTVIQYGEEGVRFPVITNGVIDEDVLDLIHHDKQWLEDELQKRNVELSRVYLGEYNDKKLVLSLYDE